MAGTKNGRLILSDGTYFEGTSFGYHESVAGECVFQTGMVGYPESLTDPSYCGQILITSFPLMGNYGVPSTEEIDANGMVSYLESSRIHVAAFIVADYCEDFSHWNASSSLGSWLRENKVPALFGVDTRAVIKRIREQGVMLGKVVMGDDPKGNEMEFYDPNVRNLIKEVSRKKVEEFGAGEGPRVVAIDCGMKNNQIRCLVRRGMRVKVVPFDYDLSSDDGFDGIFVSNGPGDPEMANETVRQLSQWVSTPERHRNRPLFGICMGNLLLGRAAGASTYKLKYGNRGHNQPCLHIDSKLCYITSQNHGYAVDVKTLPEEWEEWWINKNDGSNEGIRHKHLPFFSVQFHPEANSGPRDAEYLFDVFLKLMKEEYSADGYRALLASTSHIVPPSYELAVPDRSTIKKVLLLGSGGLTIGQAGEFDYSGSQAIKALKEEGIRTILINPNVATVQTTKGFADKVYFLSVTPKSVEMIIANERPDGVLLTFGGQTALNCGIQLYRDGVFEKYNVQILGTPIETIICTEDRERFSEKLAEINESTAPSFAATTVEEAVECASKLGFPVILRAAFALGGLGSGFAHDADELRELAGKAFAVSSQVLIERSMEGWKEIEYEVVRDRFGNCITVCNMENLDPLGIHTGESIVVAPSQTLTDDEYQMLRDVAIRVVRHLGVVGECNIQYSLNPRKREYCIIEVNARLSRSSALASKATGYPLAAVAAKLALGYSLPILNNSVTRVTTACFEPSLDYIVVKMPRWDLQKFHKVNTTISTSMKSVGEVMAIGRNFEEAIQKAVRMVNGEVSGIADGIAPTTQDEKDALVESLRHGSPRRLRDIALAFAAGIPVDRIHAVTFIDRWFLTKIKALAEFRNKLCGLKEEQLDYECLSLAKRLGFSDTDIGKCVSSTEWIIRERRMEMGIQPFVKQIDTVAAEFPAHNNYLYTTYSACEHDVEPSQATIVMGSGPYCIGSSVEFDWCAVTCIKTLRGLGQSTLMINCNPETVSTDFDECDSLFFEELSMERVLDIYQFDQSYGIILAMGGQLPNNVCMPLARAKVNILGTSPAMVDQAENRYKFSRMLDQLQVDQPRWKELTTAEDARAFCREVGKAIVRPSYVLSGAAMSVVQSESDLESYFDGSIQVSKEHPVVVSQYISNAKEIEMDAVALEGNVLTYAICEHVENAGVHSGDATLVLPPQDLDKITIDKVVLCTRKIAAALAITGPMNIQYIAKDDEVKVIECNVRASRSFPFVSKTLDYNFIELATRAIIGVHTSKDAIRLPQVDHVAVKCAQFSFSRLEGADPVSGVEMASTGEVACFAPNMHAAYLKALISTGFRLPQRGSKILLSIGPFAEKAEFLPCARTLISLGYKLLATAGTADYLNENGVESEVVDKLELYGIKETERTLDRLEGVELFINLPSNNRYRRPSTFSSPGYKLRRFAVQKSISLMTNIKCAKLLAKSLVHVTELDQLSLADEHCSRQIVRLPGLIDPHVHLREPGGEHKEDFWTGTRSALAGGFTVVLAMPNTTPSLVDEKSLRLTQERAKQKAVCDYALYCGASSSNATDLPRFAHECVALKMYLNQTFSTLLMEDMIDWTEHFKNFPRSRLICTHSESRTMSTVLLLSLMYNRPVHICHVSLRDEILLIKEAKERGVQVTCEVTPHHLFLDDKRIRELGHRSAVCPRLATEKDRSALWENLDVIDVFGSDHAPHLVSEKDSEHPPPGFPGLETTLPLLLTAVADGRLTMEDIILRCYTNPRKIFNLPEQPDTFVEVEIGHERALPDAPAFSKCGWTPFAGMKVKGQVSKVVLRGKVVFVDGKVLAEPGSGRDLVSSAPRPKRARLAVTPPEPPRVTETAPFEAHSPNSPLPLHSGQHLLQLTREARRNFFRGQNVRHIVSVHQLTRSDLREIFKVAQEMRSSSRTHQLLAGKVLGLLFYEPSSRTYASFSAAMGRLGGHVVSIHPSTSSVKKGESFDDTTRTLGSYCDCVALRHPDIGSSDRAARISSIPIINAGDGAGEHPSQALLDVFTIRDELGTVNGNRVVLVGDLKHSRTVHSLIELLSLYNGIHFSFVSPASLRVPDSIKDSLKEQETPFVETECIEEAIADADVLYVTRMQKERFASEEEFHKVFGRYIITAAILAHAKQRMIVMHPLPRVNEIAEEVDADPRAAYFRQMKNGMYVRMALLALLLVK